MSAILAIDGGATRTRAGLYTPEGELIAEAEGEGTNPREHSVDTASEVIRELASDLIAQSGKPIARIIAGIAGVGALKNGERLATQIAKDTGVDDVQVTSDLMMMFYANCDENSPIIALAGTGSSVAARSVDGTPVIAGGTGPILNDDGSAYRVAIRSIGYAEDDGELAAALIKKAKINSLQDFVWWVEPLRTRVEIAALAEPVVLLADEGNVMAQKCLADEAMGLAKLVRRAASRAKLIDTNGIVLTHGGIFENSSLFSRALGIALNTIRLPYTIKTASYVGHAAAARLAKVDFPSATPCGGSTDGTTLQSTERTYGEWLDSDMGELIDRVFHIEDLNVGAYAHYAEKRVRRAIEAAADCLRAGGRIVYAGAGTSGRLGVLDAAECPPTFGVSEDRVIALIAGGDAALRHSIEGAEDDGDAAARDLDAVQPAIGPDDFVVGITASGTTPYALAAIDHAKSLGATTALLCCNPAPLDRADIVIALDTGPEILPGSTRLKAGTATKMVLNQISTCAMALAGYVFEGRMVGVRPVNKKLRARCIRIIAELTKESPERAEQRLDETGGSIPVAVLMARNGLTLDVARARLDAANGVLRTALEED